MNFYYTVMSIYGWVLWARKDQRHHPVLHITNAGSKEWLQHLVFFVLFYIAIYFSLAYLKNLFTEGAFPWADAFASATAYTGMWLIA